MKHYTFDIFQDFENTRFVVQDIPLGAVVTATLGNSRADAKGATVDELDLRDFCIWFGENPCSIEEALLPTSVMKELTKQVEFLCLKYAAQHPERWICVDENVDET